MQTDPIEQHLPWLTPWFTTSILDFDSWKGLDIQILNELSSRWETSKKVELFDSLGMRYGNDTVARVIDTVVAANIMSEWEEISLKQSSHTIDDFIRLLWESLPAAGFDAAIEKRVDGTQIHCTRCPHAELGKKINGSYWLYHLVCSGDAHAATGFNPRIGFHRTQTLMEGHPCCDHFYFMIE